MPQLATAEDLKKYIRDIPDFPKKGIIFKDITPLLKDPDAFRTTVSLLTRPYLDKKVDLVIGIESRGFIFGAAVAFALGAGFIPIRKKGKLPFTTERILYQLEYGEDILEIHGDAIQKGDRVLVVDDVIATGGTAAAVAQLVEKLGGVMEGLAFVIELGFLKGREKLGGRNILSLIQY